MSEKKEHTGKIFGIGLSRTGTASLAKALEMLGFSSVHAETWDDIIKYQASTDTPVAARYSQLDTLYPNSKFILTVREMESWLASCQKHFEQYTLYDDIEDKRVAIEYSFCRGALYGIDHFEAEAFQTAYQRHVERAREYFRDRPDDLLEINIIAGEGFEKLCPFLGKPVLDAPFPRLNQAKAPISEDMSAGYLNVVANCYRSRQIELAQENFRLALLSNPSLSENKKQLLQWVAAEAMKVPISSPSNFIDLVFDNLPIEANSLRSLRRQAHGQYHAAAAFSAYESRRASEVWNHFLPALIYYPAHIFNLGLISIVLQALLDSIP